MVIQSGYLTWFLNNEQSEPATQTTDSFCYQGSNASFQVKTGILEKQYLP